MRIRNHLSKNRSVMLRAVVEAMESRQMLSVSGVVYLDVYNTGSYSNNTGLSGRTVYLDANNNGSLDSGESSTTTDLSGNYSLPAPASSTAVRTVSPSGWSNSSTVVISGPGASVVDNIGEYPLMNVTGTLYADTNADGSRENGEPGLSGVTVYQDVNNNATFESGEPFGVSDLAGKYTIYGIIPTTPFVPSIFVKPVAGYIAESAGTGFSYYANDTLDWGTGFANQSYVHGFLQKMTGNSSTSMSNVTVFADLNNNGVLDSGDISDITDSNGLYQFGGLPQGQVTIRMIVPAGYSMYTGSSASQTITVGALTSSLVYFRVVANTGSISGTVYNDSNQDGIQDNGESGISSGIVYIDSNANAQFDIGEQSLTPAVDGSFSFNAVAAGPYTVRMSLVTGTSLSQPASGSYSGTITTGQQITGLSFGIVGASTSSVVSGETFNDVYGVGSVTGGYAYPAPNQTVYEDLNNNNQFDTGEPSTTSDSWGVYSLTITQSGYIRAIVPTGTVITTTPDLVTPTGNTTVDIGLFQAMTIDGVVYADDNANETRDYNEPGISGALAYIDNNLDGVFDTGDTSTLTDGTGYFSFTNVIPTSFSYGAIVYIAAPNNYHVEYGSYGYSSLSGNTYTTRFGATAQSYVSGYVDLKTASGYFGIPNQTVYLDVNNSGVLDVGDITATSGIYGNVEFGPVPPGTYTARIVVPDGYSIVGSASQPVKFYTGGRGYVGFTISKATQYLGSIAGMVYQDSNSNGVFDLQELPVSGRTVYIDSNNNGKFDTGEPTQNTDSTGYYDFTELLAGSYSIGEVLPAGVSQTYPGANALQSTKLTSTVDHVSQSSVLAFGNNSVAVGGTVKGVVYSDVNSNGSRDIGDVGIGSVNVFIDSNNNGILDNGEPSQITGNDGTYTFESVVPGSYSVRILVAGSDYVTAPVTGSNIVAVSAGGSITGVDFGRSTYATISGQEYVLGSDYITKSTFAGMQVYIDANNNGALDLLEQTASTDSFGNYSFKNLKPGTYSIQQVLVSGYVQFIPASNAPRVITVTSGQITTGQDFAQAIPNIGNVSGTVTGGPPNEIVFLDSNNNSIPDTGDYSTSTAVNGNFSFVGVPIGTYTLRQILPASYTQSMPASNAGISINLTPGANLTGKDFTDTVTTNGGPTQLAGTTIGTVGSYNNSGNTVAKALDGNLLSFFDGPTASGNWVGLDLGSAAVITGIKYASRSGFASRMNGGIFQGSNVADFSIATNLFTVPAGANPSSSALTSQPISNATAFRYVRYLSAAGSYGDVSEVQFFAGTSGGGGGGGTTSPTKLAGTGVGTAGSYGNSGNTFAKAIDGNLATYFDGSTANGNWVGLDLGTATVITQVAYASRSGFASRLNGGIFQGSNSADFSNAVALFTIPAGANPSSSTLATQAVTNATAFRYVRYLSPAGSYGDIAEAQFFAGISGGGGTTSPTKLTGATIGTAGSYGTTGNTIAKAVDGSTSTYFDGPTASGNWVGLDLGSAKTITQIQFAPRSGFTNRMVGGIFQASNTADFSTGVVNLYSVTTAPPAGVLTTQSISVSGSYRYVRYLSPTGSYGDIAELAFFGS